MEWNIIFSLVRTGWWELFCMSSETWRLQTFIFFNIGWLWWIPILSLRLYIYITLVKQIKAYCLYFPYYNLIFLSSLTVSKPLLIFVLLSHSLVFLASFSLRVLQLSLRLICVSFLRWSPFLYFIICAAYSFFVFVVSNFRSLAPFLVCSCHYFPALSCR